MPDKIRRMFERAKKRLHRLREAATLPFSSSGRERLWIGLRFRLWPVSFPLAALYRRTAIRRTQVIAVIGSFGKTTTTRAVASVLGQPLDHLRWGYNAGGLLAEEIFRIRPGCQAAAVEVGIKHRGWMSRNAWILKPDLAVVTAIGTEHHPTLGSITDIRDEKAKLLRRLPATGMVLLNGDDPHVRWMASQTRAEVIFFGFDGSNDIRAVRYQSEGLSGGRFDLHVAGRVFPVRTRLIGRHQVYALLAAVTVTRALGGDLERSLREIENLQPTPRRLWPLRLENGAGLLMDDYKSVLETVDTALDALEELQAPHKIVLLGEIFEPPGEEDEIYGQVGRRIARVADGAIFIGKETAYESLRIGAGSAGLEILYAGRNVLEAGRLVEDRITPQSAVLIKGLGSQRLERIALYLSGVGIACNRVSCRSSLKWECESCPALYR